jgi:hypothetical protein
VNQARPAWRRLYEGWIAIARRFGYVQTLVILAIFYAFILGPVALGIALSRGDLLAKRGLRNRESAWREAESALPDLERARRQF